MHTVLTSLAALPASLPVPTGEDHRESHTKALPRNVENVADDARLHNPLARLERLSTGWFGVCVQRGGFADALSRRRARVRSKVNLHTSVTWYKEELDCFFAGGG